MTPLGRQDPAFGAVDLTDCDREPIRIPGSIQPHGVLLALDPGSRTIVQLAGDTQLLLGQTHDNLLGRPLSETLGASALTRVESTIRRQQISPRPYLIVEATVNDRPFEVSAHMSGGLVVLELEPYVQPTGFDAIEAVQAMIWRTDLAESLPAMLDLVVAEVGAMTGFDRVMLYRFGEDDSGHVVAEHRRSETVESFLDLHYPASDIPVQARELYCNNWIRTIPNVGYKPEPLNPVDNPVTDQPLDLSFSALRSVSPIHLEYLGNMGIGASMSLSLVVNGRLWGLVACHHNASLHIHARARAALELFAQLASLQIRSRLDLAQFTTRLQARDIQVQLVTAMTAAGLPALLSNPPNSLDLIPAGGSASMIEGKISLLGATPTFAEIEAMTAWLSESMVEGVFATDRLSERYPPARGFLQAGAGLLAISVSRPPRDYVLWFLPELIGTVTWAGDPAKAVVHGPMGDRLTPRKSFSAWTETVQERSRPWTLVELESATDLRTAIFEVVALRQMDRLAREAEGRKNQMDLLIAELDHRVKNTLATIQAVVEFSAGNSNDIVEFAHALGNRISAMAKSHNLLTSNRWKGASLRTLIQDELSSHRPRGHVSVRLIGDSVDLDPKAAMSVGLVLHELATNAVKHGSLKVKGGTVSIEWSTVRRDGQEWLTLEWRETGGSLVKPPTRVGFGRTLLEQVFAADVQGKATLEFRPEGMLCVLNIPYFHVINRAETVARPTILAPLAATVENDNSLQGLRVLVVEDGALIALGLCRALIKYGAEVIGPCSAIAHALDVSAHETIDIAVLDVDLNGEKVWPVAELLALRHIPFVFVTGYTDATLRPAEFLDTATINKPYNIKKVLSMLMEIVRNREPA